MDRTMEIILSRVQKPARYTGGEYNAVVKDRKKVDTRVALCFPDTYEIGMSNLGVRILYGVMNEMPGVWCERVFAPWGDMEEEMRREGISLYGLESGDPIEDFDIIGFSLGYEMAYSNVLNMLDLAGLPLRTEDRDEESPLIIAGGTCAYDPEPLAPFVDIFSLGEGEEVTVELIELFRRGRREGWSRQELLLAAAQIPGLYVPSLYEVTYRPDGTVDQVRPKPGAPELVTKRIVQDFDKAYFPVKTIVPSTEIVHDRVMLEVFRGCIRGCRAMPTAPSAPATPSGWWSRASPPARTRATRRSPSPACPPATTGLWRACATGCWSGASPTRSPCPCPRSGRTISPWASWSGCSMCASRD